MHIHQPFTKLLYFFISVLHGQKRGDQAAWGLVPWGRDEPGRYQRSADVQYSSCMDCNWEIITQETDMVSTLWSLIDVSIHLFFSKQIRVLGIDVKTVLIGVKTSPTYLFGKNKRVDTFIRNLKNTNSNLLCAHTSWKATELRRLASLNVQLVGAWYDLSIYAIYYTFALKWFVSFFL